MFCKEIQIMNQKNFVPALVVPLVIGLYLGCVDIPSEGHTPPDQNSSVRIIYLDPALPTATITMAPGPDFTSFSDLPLGTYGLASPYTTLLAGAKRLLIKGVDPDTSVITFGVDQRGTMFVLPRHPDVNRFTFTSERFTFPTATVGIEDTTLVRFLNTIARSSTDTVDVVVDVMQFTTVTPPPPVTGLAFGALSSFINVAKDSVVNFYLTRSGSTTEVLTDTITVTGQSHKEFTIIAHDTIDVATGKVRFTSFENN